MSINRSARNGFIFIVTFDKYKMKGNLVNKFVFLLHEYLNTPTSSFVNTFTVCAVNTTSNIRNYIGYLDTILILYHKYIRVRFKFIPGEFLAHYQSSSNGG